MIRSKCLRKSKLDAKFNIIVIPGPALVGLAATGIQSQIATKVTLISWDIHPGPQPCGGDHKHKTRDKL